MAGQRAPSAALRFELPVKRDRLTVNVIFETPLVQALDAYGHATSYTYDADGNRTGVTDALGVATHESYDALSRLVQTVRNYLGNDPATANTTTSFTYDSRDNVSQVTDPDGLVTDYYHDGLDDLGQLLSPDTGTTNYTYDAAGNRVSKADARGVISTYAYDALNRPTSISYPTASQDVYYHYDEPGSVTGCSASDPVGHLTRMLDSSGSTTYCYDDHGNVTHKRQVIGTNTYTTTYAYNSANRITGIGYPDGASVAYTRDADGRVVSVAATSATGVTTNVVTAITYLPFGPAGSYAFGNGQIQTKTFDSDYRPTGVVSTSLYLQYTLDALGNPVALKNAPGQTSPVESYAYDPLDRLQQVDDVTGAPWQSYTYDKTGDRLTKATAGIGTDNYQYQSGTHRLLDITGAEPSARAMDANGNTTTLHANGWMYGLGYADNNRLTVVQQNGTTAMSYAINGQDERVSKVAPGVHRGPPVCHAVPYRSAGMICQHPAGVATDFIYDDSGRLLGEHTGSASRDYVWAGNALVAILDNPAQGGDTIHYVYTDNLGTPRAVTTQSGTLVWDWPNAQNPFGERAASGNGYTFNLRFPGQYFDAETGLSYNYFRDYEPATGRYIQSDPIGLRGGVSTFAYVMNDPMDFTDWDAQRKHGKRAPMPPQNSGDGEPMPGAWPTSNGDLRYIEVCVRGMCPTDPNECHKGRPSMHPIYFNGTPPTMYPTMNEFQQEYRGCVCTKSVPADLTIQPGEPTATKYDAVELLNRLIEDSEL
jgi:RHS repeat-associated protein